MSGSNEADNTLLLFIQMSVDLANSVQEDAKAKGYLSEKTLRLQLSVRELHDELNEILEANSGLH